MNLQDLHEELKSDYVTTFRDDVLCVAIMLNGEKHQVLVEYCDGYHILTTNTLKKTIQGRKKYKSYDYVKQYIFKQIKNGKT